MIFLAHLKCPAVCFIDAARTARKADEVCHGFRRYPSRGPEGAM